MRINLGVLAAVFLALAVNVAAQDADTNPVASDNDALEEIVVTGIRASLKASLDVKRNADSVVDAISANDIGEFPDQNLAESLQRISGVSIDRDRGEGQFVSVRGLGPEFVRVNINGRSAPANERGTRAFRFDALQSELVSSLEVYKSPTAELTDGGLAGTINVKTWRPLDLRKRTINLSAANTYNSLSDKYNQRFSGLYSDVLNDAGTFGLLVGGSFSERELREDSIDVLGYSNTTFTNIGASGFRANNIAPRLTLEERERTNFNVAVQWAPRDETMLSLDVFYSGYDIVDDRFSIPYRFQRQVAGIANATIEDGIVTFFENPNARPRFDHQVIERKTDSLVAGLNLDQQVGRLNVNADVSWSESDVEDVKRRTFYEAGNTTSTYDIRGDLFQPLLNLDGDLTDPAIASRGLRRLSQVTRDIIDEEFQVRLDLEFELNDFVTLTGGLAYIDREREQLGQDVRLARSAGFLGEGIDLINFGQLPVDDLLNGVSGASLQTQWLSPDVRSAFDYYTNDRAAEIPAGLFDQVPDIDDFTIGEEIMAAYIGANFELEWLSRPIRGNVGLRYVTTDQIAVGFTSEILDIDLVSTVPSYVLSEATFREFLTDYDEVLPTFNLVMDVTDDFLVRFVAGRVLSRAAFEDLSPAIIADNASERTIGRGNPTLEPLIADQLDLSLEWYFAETSAVSAGLFWKELDSFINDVTALETFINQNGNPVPDPDTGTDTQLAVSAPRNDTGGTVYGFELAYQMTFEDYLPEPFDGLGFHVNWTRVETDAEFINPNTLESFDIPGLSKDTINTVLFYETDRFSARVAYNYRGAFLDEIAGLGGNPLFTDNYGQFDAKVSYRPSDSWIISVDAINIGNENVIRFNEINGRPLAFDENDTGRRIALTVSWNL